MLAAKGESTVILFDKLDGLAHFIFRKAGFEVGEVKFAHKSPRHGITMQYRTVFGQGKTLESMSYGVSQIERLAYAVLFGVLFHNIFLYLYGAPYHCPECGVVYVFCIERQQFRQVVGSADESVLQHFGIAGEKVAGIEAAQEPGFQQDGGSRGEDTDFILQSVEVDACFPPTDASTMASRV